MLPIIEGIIVGIILILVFNTIAKLIGNIRSRNRKIFEYKSEQFYQDEEDKKQIFPSFNDESSCYLSVVIPAYNEEHRLPKMIGEALDYLEENKYDYEVIIVDDGSKDNTTKIGQHYMKKFGSNKVRVLTLEENRGKGGAVQLGMMRCRGEILLFADADGATKFSDFEKLEKTLKSQHTNEINLSDSLGIVCGSRAHLEKDSIATRSYFRTLLMLGFHYLVWLFTVRGVKDTQCGFKLLTRRTARIVFKTLHIQGWAFDVEMLYIAQKLKMPIDEVAVQWTEIEGSKITPIVSWVQMGIDIMLIGLRYTIGIWKIDYSHVKLCD